MGRHNGFRRDHRLNHGFSDRNGVVSAGGGGGGSSDSSTSKCHPIEAIEEGVGEFSGVLNTIEKRLASHQQDFTQAIHKINEKENEKFDLIFAILSELQQRQAHLEDSVRSLKASMPDGNNNSNVPQPQQQGQFGSSGGCQSYGQMNGQMGGVQMNGNMGNQQPMQHQQQQQPMQQQQFGGVMQPDGTMMQTQFVTQMPAQQMIIMSPPANGGMQYAAMPQMMATPTGAIVQQMPPQMAIQFMAQNCSEMGQLQEGCQASGSSIQAQMDMIGADNSVWQSDDCSTMDTVPVEGQGSNSAMSGMGSSDASSQEGKVIDDGSPVQMLALPCPDGSMP